MTLNDVSTVFTLAGLEIILSADNAIVLAAMANTLPKHQRSRALYYGIIGAFVLRGLAILCATWIIGFWFLQVIGGLYLVWLGITHVTSDEHQGGNDIDKYAKPRSFWGTVAAIEIADLAFAVDSVLAAVAMTNKIWIIYGGAVIGLIAMRFAATMVLKLLESFPALIIYAYIMVIWIGVKLIWKGIDLCPSIPTVDHPVSEHIFWSVMALITFTAAIHWWKSSRKIKAAKVASNDG
jgi:YkoY family integral membrane protein